jgi:hypothetical protein
MSNLFDIFVKNKFMKHSEFWVQLFTGNKSISSKRVCGFTGWMVSVFICLWCTFSNVEAPQIADMLFICSTSLLGVEAVTSIFNKSVGSEKKRDDDEIKF